MLPRLLNVALGVWLVFAPAVLAYGKPAAGNDRIVGPLIAASACVAIWQVTRGVRWLNVPLGGWLLLAPWLLGYSTVPTINSLAVGLAVIVSALVRGPARHQLGGGWAALWRSENEPAQV